MSGPVGQGDELSLDNNYRTGRRRGDINVSGVGWGNFATGKQKGLVPRACASLM